jgi:hypothetical protein
LLGLEKAAVIFYVAVDFLSSGFKKVFCKFFCLLATLVLPSIHLENKFLEE